MPTRNPKAPSPGDLIQIILPTSRIYHTLGLTGFIQKVLDYPQKPKITYHLSLLRDQTPGRYEEKAEAAGRFDHRISEFCSAKHFVPLPKKDPRFARTLAFKNAEFAPESEPSPAIVALAEKLSSEEYREKEQAENTKIHKVMAKIRKEFTLPGKIERGDKSHFSQFRDPMVDAYSNEVRRYACEPREKRTTHELARWRLCHEITDQASFWSGEEEVRDAVFQLDLDPYRDEHAGALYFKREYLYCEKGTLLQKLVPLWNKGHEILCIQNMIAEERCHSGQADEPINGYLVTHSKRNQLPIPQ
jgi:hypothetical protein